MYGSSESQWLRTRTSPSPGRATGTSTMRKLSGTTAPCGRLARSTCLFMEVSRHGIRSVHPARPMSARDGGAFRESLQVMIRVAELLRDHREPPESVAHLQLVAHPHPAVELDRFLAHVAAGRGDSHLRRGHHPSALVRIGFGVHARA